MNIQNFAVDEREKELEKIKNEVLSCRKCELWKTRTNIVFGEGNASAGIMIISEAPGYNEDKEGCPFCGAAGNILNELFTFVGIKREEVYICNLLKCRPPGNRNPQKEEIEACTPYLEKQIEIIKPAVICTLGNYSTAYIMEKYGLKDQIQGISRIHGKVFEVESLFQNIRTRSLRSQNLDFSLCSKMKIIPLYHPAVATYNPNMKEILKEDFKILQKFKN